ncbi:DUF305 domain-containing protein [Microbacterium sp. RD1]|uniref:DUF305 domain-containing protein n=1 Tax=Microbacterium sp. RD1 TaxID=3457313 RepID=UPI003FA58302
MSAQRVAPRAWLLVLVAVVAAAAVAFAIGRFSAFGATAVPATPTSASADAGFARDMQVHHTQAIEMAMEIYRTTEDDTVRTLAYDIATTQAGQRGEMFGWLVEWGLPQRGGPLMSWMADAPEHGHDATATEDEMLAEMGMATPAELDRLARADGTEADCLFLELMTRHHRGAIPMAEAIIERGSVPRVVAVAKSMIANQSAEIDAMTASSARLGCS